MRKIVITSRPGFEEWRAAARDALHAGVAPHMIIWQNGDGAQDDLFAPPLDQCHPDTRTEEKIQHRDFRISKEALKLCQSALCHSDPERFSLCYRIIWRLKHENRNLLHLKTDADVMHLTAFVKAVHRDAYKMSAYLRFREVECDGQAHFIAWYEPEHYTLELKIDFFVTRFKNMRWSGSLRF